MKKLILGLLVGVLLPVLAWAANPSYTSIKGSNNVAVTTTGSGGSQLLWIDDHIKFTPPTTNAPNGYVLTIESPSALSYWGPPTIGVVTNAFTIVTNLQVINNFFASNSFINNEFVTNLFVNTEIVTNLTVINNLVSSNVFITNLFATTEIVTNLTVVNNLTVSNEYVTNLFATTEYVTNIYVLSNLYAFNILFSNSVTFYTTNVSISNFVFNGTFVTNINQSTIGSINPTIGRIPYNLDGTNFADSPFVRNNTNSVTLTNANGTVSTLQISGNTGTSKLNLATTSAGGTITSPGGLALGSAAGSSFSFASGSDNIFLLNSIFYPSTSNTISGGQLFVPFKDWISKKFTLVGTDSTTNVLTALGGNTLYLNGVPVGGGGGDSLWSSNNGAIFPATLLNLVLIGSNNVSNPSYLTNMSLYVTRNPKGSATAPTALLVESHLGAIDGNGALGIDVNLYNNGYTNADSYAVFGNNILNAVPDNMALYFQAVPHGVGGAVVGGNGDGDGVGVIGIGAITAQKNYGVIGFAPAGYSGAATNIGVAGSSTVDGHPERITVGGHFEVRDSAPAPGSPPALHESAALVLDVYGTGLPLIIARTNNGTTVFNVQSSGLVSNAVGYAFPLGSFLKSDGVSWSELQLNTPTFGSFIDLYADDAQMYWNMNFTNNSGALARIGYFEPTVGDGTPVGLLDTALYHTFGEVYSFKNFGTNILTANWDGSISLSGQTNLLGMAANQLTFDGVPIAGSSQTPWLSDIDGARFQLTNTSGVAIQHATNAVASGAVVTDVGLSVAFADNATNSVALANRAGIGVAWLYGADSTDLLAQGGAISAGSFEEASGGSSVESYDGSAAFGQMDLSGGSSSVAGSGGISTMNGIQSASSSSVASGGSIAALDAYQSANADAGAFNGSIVVGIAGSNERMWATNGSASFGPDVASYADNALTYGAHYTNTVSSFAVGYNGATAFRVNASGLTTGIPTGGAVSTNKFGAVETGLTITTSVTNAVRVEINGTKYWVMIANQTPP